mmetsp:Transcript_73269/g.202188  ORF Transcript_73269/g.202188 Transcript_73269/m.202188 type:complete len:217 (+) Transcript_73269:377-1027(+)
MRLFQRSSSRSQSTHSLAFFCFLCSSNCCNEWRLCWLSMCSIIACSAGLMAGGVARLGRGANSGMGSWMTVISMDGSMSFSFNMGLYCSPLASSSTLFGKTPRCVATTTRTSSQSLQPEQLTSSGLPLIMRNFRAKATASLGSSTAGLADSSTFLVSSAFLSSSGLSFACVAIPPVGRDGTLWVPQVQDLCAVGGKRLGIGLSYGVNPGEPWAKMA